MMRASRTAAAPRLHGCCAVVAVALCGPLAAWAQPSPPFWGSYGRDAQHTGLSDVASAPFTRIRWQTPVDRRPPYTDTGSLLIHYGSPLVTQANTVLVPLKRRSSGGFQVVAVSGVDGRTVWRQSSNYLLPPHDWTPPFSPALSSTGKLWMPGAGGTLFSRTSVDVRGGAHKQQVAFYGFDNYRAGRRAYLLNVFINTP